MQSRLLLATNNQGKIRELRNLLSGLKKVEIVTPQDLGLTIEVDESGETYAENAALKVEAFAQASGLISLADDSGVEVDALNGAPGLRSARYSPRAGATDADRRAYLLENLVGIPRPWKGRFRATIAVAAPGKAAQFSKGVCEGEIIPEERGMGGFGYDPIFLLQGRKMTMAELSEEEKNIVSHRGKAVMAAMGMLRELL